MQVNRRFLYWGILLVAIGGVLVASDLGAIDTPTLTAAVRLWPLAVVAIGLNIVLQRTQFNLPGLVLAAAVPGIVLGAGFAVAPRFAGDCGARGEPVNAATERGVFEGPATVTIRTGCGTLEVRTAPGAGWELDARNTAGRAPVVVSSARSLSIDVTGDDRSILDAGRDAWDVTLPTSDIESLSLRVLAGRGRIVLLGAQITTLALTANAGEIVLDASEASVTELSAVVNVGSLSIRLPANSDLVGSMRVGAGELRICAPPGLGLRVTSKGVGGRVSVDGLQQHESVWQSPDYASATHHADLTVSATFGAVAIDPIGGCE
jgi:hypothetical protein